MWKSLHVKYPLLLSEFNGTWGFSTDFWKNAQMSNLIKIIPVGAELLQADGMIDDQTDGRDEANSRFSQFCERA